MRSPLNTLALRLGFTLLALSLSLAPAALSETPAKSVSSQAQTTAADHLADEILGAYGGLDKLKELKEDGYKSKGHFSVTSTISGAANAFACDIIGKGDKIRIETHIMGQDMILGFDGKNSWTQVGDWVAPSTETTAKRIVEELKHGLNLLCEIKDPARSLTALGRKNVFDKACDAISVLADDGKATTFYVDPATHLVVRSEYMGVDHEQGIPALQTVDYFDYRPVAGSPAPFKTVEYVAGKKTAETTLDSLEMGIKPDDKLFQIPAESEVARVKTGPVTIPFEVVGNAIVVKVRLNNKSDYRFIVDTGASQTVLDKATAHQFGPTSQADFSITAGAKAVPLGYTTIDSLGLGDLTLDKIPALVTDLSAFARAGIEKPTGLLGSNVLRRFLVTIDYKDKKLVLADPKNVTVPAGAMVVPTSPVFGATALVVTGKVDGKKDVHFLVDTGAAFNNLPQSAAKGLVTGQVLSVGQIFGIDGRKLSIGSVRLKSVTVGPLTLEKPVFALAPEQASQGVSGLFTAGALGILGNPVWSQFRMMIDYRNERLILERYKDKEALASIANRLDQAALEARRTKNLESALKACESLAAEARAGGFKSAEALALTRQAELITEDLEKTRNTARVGQASSLLQKAQELARQSRDQAVEARILAQSANLYIISGAVAANPAAVQALLQKAITLSPGESSIYTVLASTSARLGNSALTQQLVDQALLLDPTNWKALWLKHGLAKTTAEKALVVAQLRRYYAECPEVKVLPGATPTSKQAPRRATAGAKK